ncbi:Uncharacterized protein At4g14450, chloroplastic [Linum grandiflorum]
MADRNGKSKISSSAQQQSRLQRRRPASLQITTPAPWNAPIPLLSPLETSPTAIELSRSREDPNQKNQHRGQADGNKAVVFKKWQHPAAPFCYEPPKFKPASFFVPV